MSVQILGKGKKVALKRRHARLRKHISGTPELPRLVVTRSNRHMVAQIIDDTKGVTLVSESTLTSDFAQGCHPGERIHSDQRFQIGRAHV